jgi:hypothetical protein
MGTHDGPSSVRLHRDAGRSISVTIGGMDRHYNGSRFLGCGCQASPNPFVAQQFGSPDNAGARQTPRPKCRMI